MTLWLYLHFPSLQLNSLFCDRDEQAIIIIDGRGNKIVQLNPKAAESGIKKGMGLGTAASFCRDLQVHAYDPKCEQAKLLEIAHYLYLVTSDISLSEPNGLLLKVSNMLTLYQGLDSFWLALRQHLAPLQIQYYFATGYSPLACRLLAKAGLNRVLDDKNKLLAALNKRPLCETELSAKQIDKLSRVGVKTLNDLLSLPMTDISKRFDVELLNYVGLLTGQFHTSVDFHHPPEQFSRYLELLFEVENLQYLHKPLLKLLEQLEAFLKVRDQLTHELSLTLHQRSGEAYILSTTSAEGDYQAQKWRPLFELRFESVKLIAPVQGITLSAKRLVSRSLTRGAEALDLFEGKKGHTTPLELVSILQAKLGQKAVRGIALTNDPRPDFSTRYCAPLAETLSSPLQSPSQSRQQSSSRQYATEITVNKALLRPSILLPRPRPLNEKVSLIQGPERLATGWWDDRPMIRDYFIARSAKGCWLWVFRTQKQHWFIHGVFS
jgi:protein ImuB